jgi:radical SAM superfamily enzyme YgiQ (UPF0313 family)
MKYKKVVLVDVRQPTAKKATGFNEFIEPIGLCYIASFIEKYGYEAKLIQQCFKTDKETLKEILDSKPDMVGFTSVTCTYPKTRKFSKILRKKGIITVIGGSHATADPINCSKDFDYVGMCEGEGTLLELLNCLNKNKSADKIKGLAFYSKSKRKVIINYGRKRMNFEKQPFPSRKGLDLSIYKKTFIINPFPQNIRNVASICSSKGCPYNCSFCANKIMWNQVVRVRSVKHIVDEIEMLNKKHNVDYIWFHDETFTFNRQRVIDLCNEIIKRKLNIYWGCMGRVNTVDEELLKFMKKAGCHYIAYGVESADPKILKLINKQITLDVVEKAMKMTFELGIVPRAFFIIGLPYDNQESLEKMKKFAKRIYCLSYRFSNFYPLLGTKDREYVDKHNLWLPNSKKLEYATTLRPVVKCKTSPKFVKEFSEDILSEIYSSKEYQKRKDEFITKWPEMTKSYKVWKEYNIAIKKAK